MKKLIIAALLFVPMSAYATPTLNEQVGYEPHTQCKTGRVSHKVLKVRLDHKVSQAL